MRMHVTKPLTASEIVARPKTTQLNWLRIWQHYRKMDVEGRSARLWPLTRLQQRRVKAAVEAELSRVVSNITEKARPK